MDKEPASGLATGEVYKTLPRAGAPQIRCQRDAHRVGETRGGDGTAGVRTSRAVFPGLDIDEHRLAEQRGSESPP